MKGKLWPTVEHYYQVQKFVGREDEEEIRLTATPSAANEMANGGPTPSGPIGGRCDARSA